MGTINYVSLSLATALERSLDLSAHNMANASTAGYKVSHPLLEAVEPTGSGDDSAVEYVKDYGNYVDTTQGAMLPTGNPLDVAVSGDAWLGYQTATGDTAYGRDGRLTIDTEGQLVTLAGAPVVDITGSTITLPSEVGQEVTIARDGTITDVTGATIGRLGLFNIPDVNALNPIGNGMFLLPDGAEAAEASTTSGIAQGYIEQSNVKPVVEMIHLMDIQRAYERAVKLMNDENDLTKQAVERLGRVV
jgi:flagellar basal-body rod protein FlgF